ncbi:MFS transporter, partial [Pseudomonas sp. SB113]|uniref:MFS transporter n=1 Tax=Pseudomonas sp. SB113 TaxID=3154123 RepID=UPI00345CC974
MPMKSPVWAYTLPAALLLMAPFDILASLAMDIYLPVVPAMPGVLDTSPGVVQLSLSLYMLILGVGQIVFGPISDRVGRRPVLLGWPESVVIYSLFGSMLAFVPALGPSLGAMIADNFGWRAIFAVLAAVTVPAIINAFLRWHETRPQSAAIVRRSMLPILRSGAFWAYTLAFSAAMGTFFVFFSTAPRVLIERAGYSELEFSFAFATAAIVM